MQGKSALNKKILWRHWLEKNVLNARQVRRQQNISMATLIGG